MIGGVLRVGYPIGDMYADCSRAENPDRKNASAETLFVIGVWILRLECWYEKTAFCLDILGSGDRFVRLWRIFDHL